MSRSAECAETTIDGPASGADIVLLVGHGTRDPAGKEEFLALSALVAGRLAPIQVRHCFLELSAPDIADAIRNAVDRGVRRLAIVPVLLFAAGHARRDIPLAVNAALRSCESGGRVFWTQADVLDGHPSIAGLSEARYRQALGGRPVVAPAQTCLVMVGRGSHDTEATAAMRQFAELRGVDAQAARVETGFMAMAEPHYREVLENAARRGFRRIVVQPHLLFRGQLLKEVAGEIERLGREFPAIEWITAAHLGPDPRLADAIAERATAALASLPASPS